MNKFVLNAKCESHRRGVGAAIATFLAKHGCNVTDAAQFDDVGTDSFFTRTCFTSEEGVTLEALRNEFPEVAAGFDMEFSFHDVVEKTKVVIMVSRFGHCLNDLLYRWRIGALPIDIVAVISNHMDYQKV
ncbi:ACT domain-containing protein, partial [Sinirhodobacter sp. WL0062]